MKKVASRLATASALVALGTVPALAHHAMGGATPTSVVDGLLTGLAHPLIGLDHFAFVIAVGVLAAVAGARLFAPLFFVGGTLVGCALSLSGLTVPASEWLIIASVLALGTAVALGHRRVRRTELGLFAGAGVLHGMAYAAGIIGAEAAPLGAYLVGFAIIQSGLTVGVMLAMRLFWRSDAIGMPARLAGAAVAGIGFAFAFEAAETLLLPVVS